MYFLEVIEPGTCPADLKPVFTFIINILNLIKIVIPILLIVFGSIDLGKAVVAGEDKEVAKAQNMLVKRVITAAAIFFIVPLISLVMSLVTPTGSKWNNCLDPNNLKSFNTNNTIIVEKI